MGLIVHGTNKKTKRFLLLPFSMCILLTLFVSPSSICYAINSMEGRQIIVPTVIEKGKTIETDQVTQYGITFIFDGLYTVGTFANGDFWVKTGESGNVVITRITPDYVEDGDRWIHGWEINPTAGTKEGQGFCSEIASFDPDLVPDLPYLAGPGESILKSVRSDVLPREDQKNRAEQALQTMVVLTVVAEPPPGNGAQVFRPPYVAINKPYYYVSNLRTDLLPSVEPAGKPPTLQQIARWYKMVQIEHKGVAMGYDMRPLDNFINSVYGGAVGKRYGEAALRLMLNDPLEDKMEALIHFTQMSIDFYHNTLEGRNYGPGGGHQPGHSLPLAWFAVMLGDDEAKKYVKNEAVFKTSEHDFLQPSTLDSSRALYGSENMVFMSFNPRRYWEYITLDKNPTDMYNICYPDPYGYIDGGGSLNRSYSGYQNIMSGPWQGLVIAGTIMPELAQMYNNPLLFDYVQRWFTQGQLTQLDPAAPSTGNMDDYGILFGDDPNNPGTPILDPRLAYYNSPTDFGYPEGVQGGRWPERHGNNVGAINPPYYSAAFFAPMWDKYYPSPAPTPQEHSKDPPSTENLITTDYPEMVRLLELLYQSADIRDNTLNPTYGFMMKREPVITLTAGYQEKLRELAKLTFKDIRGDEWYASHIPLSVYRKLVKGFPDKTFRGGNLVSRAEMLTMLARFNSSEGLIKQKAEQDAETWIRFVEQFGNDWYTQYVVVAKDGLVHPDQYTKETILKPMTRGEVIYALANLLWNEDIQEGGKYYNMAVVNDNPAFYDTMKTITISNPDVGTIGHKTYSWYKQLVLAAENPKAGVPMDFYPAILCLKDKGILLGNKGDSKWNDPITRAEVLALFERLAKVWGKAPTPTPTPTPGSQKAYYVRQGANGDNNGVDWNNAWTKLPDVLERGATYYIASGTYPPYTFDDPEQGDAYIVIKKATVDDHGTAVGWKNGYATGVALFTAKQGSIFTFTKGYYIIDGQTGEDDNGHGIKLYNPMNIAPHLGGNCMRIPNNAQVRYLTLRHIEMEDAGWAGSGKDDAYITRTIYATGATAHITFQYCYIHDSGQEWMLFSNPESDFLIEHCYFKNGGSGSSASHSVGIWHRGEKENMNIHIRYNTFENFAAAGGTGYISLGYRGNPDIPTYSSGYYIYGNIFKETSPLAGPSRAIGSNGANGGPFLSDVKIYNNTFYNMNGKLASRINLANKGDNNLVANNIWHECDNAPSIGNIEEKNNIKKNLTDDPFIDAAGGNFRLSRELPGGMVLEEPFNKDMDGAVRGTDNEWDIGAFEYKAPTPTTSPTEAPTPTPTKAPTAGKTYYVDYDSGNDNHDGLSLNTAWKHAPIDINAEGNSLAVKLSPGDTILFRSDVVYRGKMLASKQYGQRVLGSGEADNPIILKGDGWGEGKAIIDGSEPLTGWTKCQSAEECGGNENWENIWYATVPPEWTAGKNRALTLNPYQADKMMSVAQYPDQPNAFYFDDTSYFSVADEYATTYLEADALGGINLTGSRLALLGGNNSVLIRTPASFDPSTNRVTFETITNPYGKYSILNSIDSKVLNRQGEFYFDEAIGRLYIWPFDSADPNNEGVSISVRSSGIEFWSGNNYVAVEGFIVQKFIGSGICWNQSPVVYGCVIRDNEIRYCRSADGCQSIRVGAMMNALVEGNEVYNNAGPLRGISCLGGSGHIVRNNTIRESGKTGIYFTGVTNGFILNNTVIDNKGKHSNGISVYGDSKDVLVAKNQEYNSNIAYTMEHSTDIYLFNNILIGSHGNTGISVWSGMNGMHLYHNMVSSWYLNDKSTNVNTANNIILGTGDSPKTESMDLYLQAKPATDMSTIFHQAPVVRAPLADVHKFESSTNVSTVYLADEGYENIIEPGHYLRYDQDTVHLITTVSRVIYKGNYRTKIELDSPIATVEKEATVEVWKEIDDFSIDYHLFDGSDAVNEGIDISGLLPVDKFPSYDFTKDLDGSPRTGVWDIGPYEYGGGEDPDER